MKIISCIPTKVIDKIEFFEVTVKPLFRKEYVKIAYKESYGIFWHWFENSDMAHDVTDFMRDAEKRQSNVKVRQLFNKT